MTKPGCTLLVALGLAAVVSTSSGQARAYERQWRAGLDFGYALAGFPDHAVSGFGGGAHLTYGLTDVFNLRLHGDVTAFDLPEPATSAIIYNAALGAELVLDVLRWVPYVGAMAGPTLVSIQAGETLVHLGLELPAGIGYQLSRSWTIGIEGRYRLLLPGQEQSPTHNLTAFGRIEYVWGF